MTYLKLVGIGLIFFSCQETAEVSKSSITLDDEKWNIQLLQSRALNHLDSSKWDKELFQQDVETYNKYIEIFQCYPLNKSPFPVATYDYAVASIPFTIEVNKTVYKGVRIGEYLTPESDTLINKLTLLILTNGKDLEDNTLVESRNYPYLTAQGTFEVENNEFDWFFLASPDGFSSLILNMKLFDLRFGETVVIYPQNDNSFLYNQINDSPNNYESFEEFKERVLNKLIKKPQSGILGKIEINNMQERTII
jgi:hypothetical protein